MSAAGAAGAIEWFTCPHCGYGWAYRIPSRKSEPPPDEPEQGYAHTPAAVERTSAYTTYAVCGVFWLGGAAVMVASRERVLAPPFFGVGFVVCWAATVLAGVVANAGRHSLQHPPEAPVRERGTPAEPDEAGDVMPTHQLRRWWALARIILVGSLLAVLIGLVLSTSR
jgi:hypothetical protein